MYIRITKLKNVHGFKAALAAFEEDDSRDLMAETGAKFIRIMDDNSNPNVGVIIAGFEDEAAADRAWTAEQPMREFWTANGGSGAWVTEGHVRWSSD